MSRRRDKHKKSASLEYRRQPIADLLRQAQQARDRGNIRVAVEIAKECHKREPTEAHARLLGGLYADRARQLMAQNLYPEATVVLSHALSLGHVGEDVLWMVFECGLRSRQYASALGVFQRLRDPGEQARARVMLADEVVARGEEFGRLCNGAIRDDAFRIRRAFEAFERGDDAAAAAELKLVGLNSPCASWKWLLLGLTAHAQGDAARARTCWERPGLSGRAGRLAVLLRSLVSADGNGDLSPKMRQKLVACMGNPRLPVLEQIKAAIDREDTPAILQLSRQLINLVGPEERRAYAERLGRVLCLSLDWDEMDDRTAHRTFGTLAEDPRWTRTLALWSERRDPPGAVYLWMACVEMIRQLPEYPARLKARAQAMVWKRMGDLARHCDPDDLAEAAAEAYSYRVQPLDAATCYRNSIKLHPDDRDTHDKLLRLLIDRGAKRAAEQQAEAILERWPADVPSLMFLGKSCFERDAVRKALKYFDRARQAEPFNAKVRAEMRACFLSSARRRLNNGNFKLARQDFEQAEGLLSPGEQAPDLYCKWAAMEWRAGESQRAEALLARAMDSGEGPLPVSFRMAIEAARALVPPEVRNLVEQRLAEQWQREPTAADAAKLAEIASLHIDPEEAYEGQSLHMNAAIRYLERAASRDDFTEEQALAICEFLRRNDEWATLEAWAARASKRWPGNRHFILNLGRAQFRTQRRRMPRETLRLLDKAGEEAVRVGDLTTAAEVAAMLFAARPAGLTGRLIDAARGVAARLGFASDDDSDDFDESDLDFFLPPPRPPRRRRRVEPSEPLLWDDRAATESENP